MTGILQAGDYIQVTALNALGVNMQRIYKVLFTANSDSGGNATFQIFPTLREVPTSGTAIVLNNTAGTFRLIENPTEYKILEQESQPSHSRRERFCNRHATDVLNLNRNPAKRAKG